MKKISSKWIGSVKKKAGDFLDKKEGNKDGKEVKDKPVVAEDPAVILEEDNLLEESSDEVLKIDDVLSPVFSTLRESLKRVSNSTRQLVTVGKHFSKQISDSAMEKQLIAGYENLAAWSDTLNAETKKLAPPTLTNTIKVVTVKKLGKICKYTCQAATILLVAVKSVAAFDADNADVQKQVAMSTRALRDAIQQLVSAWEGFPAWAISDWGVVTQILAISKQIISMCDNVEAASGIAGSSIVTLTSTRAELIAACRATAAATTRLIYAQTNGKYKSITPATTTMKVIVSTTTQVLTVTTNISSILFKQDEASNLKNLLACAAINLKKAVDKLDDTGKESSLRYLRSPTIPNGENPIEISLEPSVEEKETNKSSESTTKPGDNTESVEGSGKSGDAEEIVFPDEPSKLSSSTRSVSQPIVSLSGSTIVNVKRAFTTAPPVSRSSTLTSPQRPTPSLTKQISFTELNNTLKEIQTMIDNQAHAVTSVQDFNRKKSNSVSVDDHNLQHSPTSSTPPSSSPVLGSTSSLSISSPSHSSFISPPDGSKIHAKPLPPLPPLPPVPPVPSSARHPLPPAPPIPPAFASKYLPRATEPNGTPDTDSPTSTDSDPSTSPTLTLNRSGGVVHRSDSPGPHASLQEMYFSPGSSGPTTPSELNETLSWSFKASQEGARNSRISIRINPPPAPPPPASFPRYNPHDTPNPPNPSNPPNPPSPVVVVPSNNGLVSPPLSPMSASSPTPSEQVVRKATTAVRKEEMTLYRLFELIPGSKEEHRIPHASKKLLKVLVALVAAYTTAIDLGIAEIKDIAAKAQSEVPRHISSFSISNDSSTPIANQHLADAFQSIESSIPALPLTPPPQPPSSDSGRQSGDAGVEIWSEPPDEDGVNVLFNESGKIRAGTLNKLVERLTSPTEADLKFMKTFIATYRSFCTPEILLQKIMQRFDVPASEAASELPIRLRVCNVLRQWVENRYLDFDDQLIETLTYFIEAKMINHKSYKTFATSILNIITAKKQSEDIPRVVSADLRTDSKGIQLSPSRLLFVFDEEEIAKQLTLIDFSIYSAIQPVELLNLAWNTPKYKHRAPHVMALIARANLLSNWVASVVLWQPKLRDRVKIMAKLISIAKHLRDLNNFNSLVAVLAGLNNSAIHRLRFSREDLPKQSQETFKELEEAMNVNASYKTYRGLLHNVNPPCLPFLGVYLTDLTFVEEGNPDYIKSLINFGKRELVYNILAEIQQYQLTPYVFPLVDNIASFLDQLPHIQGDKDMYNISLLREPREATKESII